MRPLVDNVRTNKAIRATGSSLHMKVVSMWVMSMQRPKKSSFRSI